LVSQKKGHEIVFLGVRNRFFYNRNGVKALETKGRRIFMVWFINLGSIMWKSI